MYIYRCTHVQTHTYFNMNCSDLSLYSWTGRDYFKRDLGMIKIRFRGCMALDMIKIRFTGDKEKLKM